MAEKSGSLCKPMPRLGRSRWFGSGGFSEVYQDPQNPDRLIKVLKTPLTGEAAERVYRLIHIDTWARPSDHERFLTRFAWPLECFGQSGEVTGFSMPKAQPNFWFDLQAAGQTKSKLLHVKYLSNAKYWQRAAVQSSQPAFSETQRRELSIDIFDSLGALHRNFLVFGDISSNNICAGQGKEPQGFFLDADSIGLPDEIEQENITTPDWETPENLAPFERSVCLAALLAWRLFTESSTTYPKRSVAELYQGPARERFEKMLEVYQTGNLAGLEELARLFRSHRTQGEAENAIDQAAKSQFARNILREANAGVSPAHQQIIESAIKQVGFEEAIDAAPAKERLKLLGKGALAGSAFKLDVLPESSSSLRPTSVGQLRDMIFDARFEDIAVCIAEKGLGPLELDPWLPRVVQHALIHVDVPTITTTTEPGRTIVQWEWPNIQYVTAAVIYIRSSGYDNVRELIIRRAGDRYGSAEINCSEPMKGHVYLRLAVKSSIGREFVGTPHSAASFIGEPIPQPRRLVSTLPSSGNLENRRLVEVVDPVVEAEREERERLEARKYRRRKVLLGAAAVLLTGIFVGAVINLFWEDPKNTQVVFASDRDGDWDIYVTGPKVGEETPLTYNNFDDRNPQWSPDGQFIVFESFRDGDWEIMQMNSDGSDEGSFTANEFSDRDPAWADNGRLVLFASDRDGNWEIYSTGQESGVDTRLTYNNFDDRNPQWSAGGDYIVFESFRDGDWEIMRMNSDGSDEGAFTVNEFSDRDPAWADNGRLVLFASDRDGNWEIYSTGQESGVDTRLTYNNFDDRNPQWSPDGRFIVFESMYDGDWEIMRMSTGEVEWGTRFKVYTENDDQDRDPAWNLNPSNNKETKKG